MRRKFSSFSSIFSVFLCLVLLGSLIAFSLPADTADSFFESSETGSPTETVNISEPAYIKEKESAMARNPSPTKAEASARPISAEPSPAAVSLADSAEVSQIAESKAEPSPRSEGDRLKIGDFQVREKDVIDINPSVPAEGELLAAKDFRVYRLRLSHRGVLQLRFVYHVSENAGNPWKIDLYESYSANGSGENDAFRHFSTLTISAGKNEYTGEKIGVYPGEFYIIVSPGDVLSVDAYTLYAEFTDATPWEAEPNDSLTRYNELSEGVRTGGSCSRKDGGDKDYYLLYLPKKGILNLLFEHSDEQLPQVGWILTLTNANGEILYKKLSNYKDISLESGEIGLDAGYYYAVVESHILCTVDYYLTYTFEEIATYENEPNDTKETANPIPIGDTEAGMSGSLSDKTEKPDFDWYQFELDENGVIAFSFVHKDYTRNRDGWNISITDESGKTIYHMISRWSDMAITSPQIGLSKGKYYICVDSENMLINSGTYILALSFAEGNWESEPNQTAEEADAIQLNETINGALIHTDDDYDTDYYTFELKKTSAITIEFTHAAFTQSFDGWRVTLMNESGKAISSLVSKWTDKSIATPVINLPAGSYHIAIETGARFTETPYQLTVRGA